MYKITAFDENPAILHCVKQGRFPNEAAVQGMRPPSKAAIQQSRPKNEAVQSEHPRFFLITEVNQYWLWFSIKFHPITEVHQHWFWFQDFIMGKIFSVNF